MSEIALALAYVRRWWHCLRCRGHRPDTAWSPDDRLVFLGCSCGYSSYRHPKWKG